MYAVTSGSSNAYVLAPSPALGAYAAGNRIIFEPNFTNTASATINVSSLGAKTIKTVYGEALAGGELVSGGIYSAVYDGTDFLLVSTDKKLRGCVVVTDAASTSHDSWTQLSFVSGDIKYDTSSIADATNNYFTIPDDANAVLMTASTMLAASGVSAIGAGVAGAAGVPGTGVSGNYTLAAANISDNATYNYRGIRAISVANVFEMPLINSGATGGSRRLYAFKYMALAAGSGTALLPLTVGITILE